MTAPRLTKIVVFALAVALAPATHAGAEQRTLRIVTDGPFADDPDIPAAFSGATADGTRAFFETKQVMAGSDTDTATDAYARSTAGALVHLSDGLGPDGPVDVDFAAASADGTRACFVTAENLLPTDTDVDTPDVYERTASGALVHVSDNPTWPDANGTDPGCLAVTSRVYFETDERLVADDTDNATDIYARGPSGLQVLTDGYQADSDGDAEFGRVTADGTLYFAAREALVPGDSDAAEDVYARTAAGALVLVSDDAVEPDPDIEARFRDAGDDGSVWFRTRESLAPTDGDTTTDVYRRTRSGALEHVSRRPVALDTDADALYLARSGDGTHTLFETTERLLPSDTDAAYDIYDRPAGGPLVHVSGGSAALDAGFVDVSHDGSRILFKTKERLTATDTDAAFDAYERLANGALVHVSDTPGRPDGAFDATPEAISGDGARVLFTTKERLAATDTDTAVDVYERGPDGLRLVTGSSGNQDAIFEDSSPDGRRVYFATDESLAAADTDAVRDVYVSTAVAEAVRPADRTPPALSGVRVRGRTLRFVLSEPARVRVTLKRGRHVRRFTVAGTRGVNRVRLRVKTRGRYRLTITATDLAGNRAVRRVAVRIKRRAR
jgi:hypothetical protein